MTAVGASYLQQLNDAVAELSANWAIRRVVAMLKIDLQYTSQPFVWSEIDLKSVETPLPDNIKSAWIFVLKKNAPSGCHYHPNSIQHMVMVEGKGTSKVGTNSERMKLFVARGSGWEESWYVIPEGVPHEFFPEGIDVVVMSFHTCEADELEEISCDSGASRHYETR